MKSLIKFDTHVIFIILVVTSFLIITHFFVGFPHTYMMGTITVVWYVSFCTTVILEKLIENERK
jgi:hypothetical protein